MFEKSIKDIQIPYLKLNSSPLFELLSEKEYFKEINNLPKMFSDDITMNEEKITKFFNIILPESKEGDILKTNFALSNGCKKNKDIAHQCLNDIMNMKESSTLFLTKDLVYKLSQIIKEIFRRFKKYSNIKTYEELLLNAKDFLYKGGNIINKYMIEKKIEKFGDNNVFNLIQRDDSNTVVIDKKSFNHSSEDLPKFNKTLNRNRTIEFQFREIKEEKKKNLPAEMRCLIKKFTTIKNLKLSINNNKSHNNLEEFTLDMNDIQNTIIILYNSEWLFQNLLEIEIDLTNDSLQRIQNHIQSQNLKKLSEILNTDINLPIYHFGLNKNIIFNPYQLSNFYSSLPKLHNDNFLYIYQHINEKNILTYELDNEIDEEEIDDFINDKKYIFEIIVVYAYFLLKLKNSRQ